MALANKVRVRVVMRDDTPLGIPSGKTIWHVEVQSSGDAPFNGCPLGRSTAGEAAAIRDLVRPGYALPFDTTVTAADVEVVERVDYRNLESGVGRAKPGERALVALAESRPCRCRLPRRHRDCGYCGVGWDDGRICGVCKQAGIDGPVIRGTSAVQCSGCKSTNKGRS